MAKKKQAASDDAQPVIVSYKGFGPDWKCRDFQYAVGQTYEHKGAAIACQSGFHACEHPLDVFGYYPPAGSRFAIVEQSGEIGRHEEDTKIASSRIHIKAEISFAGMIQAAVDWTFSRAKPIDPESPAHSTREQGHASATGDSGAASATGYRGAASATGYSGAASATGPNSAAMASGRFGRAMGADGCALFLVERDTEWKIVAVWSGIVGRDGIEPNVFYTLEDGNPVKAEG